MAQHLTSEQLADLAARPASDAARDAHLADCAACSAGVAGLRRTLTVLAAGPLEAPPAAVVARAAHLFRTRFPATAPAPSLVTRLVAALRFDSRQQPTVGLRGGPAAGYQLIWAADEYEIEAQVAPAGDGWQLSGQVFGPAELATLALSGGDTAVSAALGAEQEFVLPAVPSGRYTLTLSRADVQIAAELVLA